MKKKWWKILCLLLLAATFILGFGISVPYKSTLQETIRNYFFHPALWVVMMVLFTTSFVNSIIVLRNRSIIADLRAAEFGRTGLVFGVMGLLTGMVWAKYTWGAFWSGDPKQTGTLVGLLIYAAYFVLRNSISDDEKRARVAAVYNIFAFTMLFPTLFIIPRMVESLHPGAQGNPLINPSDIEPKMFIVLWCIALPGYIMMGLWVTSLRLRLRRIEEKDAL